MMLKTQRLLLRGLEITDLNEKYLQWLNNPDINQYLETRFNAQTINSIKRYWESHESDSNSPWFAICLRDEERHIGNIKLGPINWVHRKADISLFIGERDCWGKGYASEAIEAVKEWAFRQLQLHKLCAGIYSSNVGSIKAFQKCGFVIEGRLQEEVIFNGCREDILKMGIINQG